MKRTLINAIGVILLLLGLLSGYFYYTIHKKQNSSFPVPSKEYSTQLKNPTLSDKDLNNDKTRKNFTNDILKVNNKNITDDNKNNIDYLINNKNNLTFRKNRLIIPSQNINIHWYSTSFSKKSNYFSLNLDDNANVGTLWAAAKSFDKGSTIIAAHSNDKWGNLGSLTRINHMKSDDLIIVTDGNGKPIYYKTVSLHKYLKRSLPDSLFKKDGDSTLSLITCGGALQWSSEQGFVSHTDNVVLTANKINK